MIDIICITIFIYWIIVGIFLYWFLIGRIEMHNGKTGESLNNKFYLCLLFSCFWFVIAFGLLREYFKNRKENK